MTVEQIKQRINQLQQEADQLKHNLSATIGALQDCHFWLNELQKPAEEVQPA